MKKQKPRRKRKTLKKRLVSRIKKSTKSNKTKVKAKLSNAYKTRKMRREKTKQLKLRKKRSQTYKTLKRNIIDGDDYYIHKRKKEVDKAYSKGNLTKTQKNKLYALGLD